MHPLHCVSLWLMPHGTTLHTHMHAHTCTPTHLCIFATRLFGKRIPSFKVYLKKNFKKFTLYIWVFCLHVCVGTAYMPSTSTRQKMCQISWNHSCRWLWAIMWVLGIKPKSSGTAVSTLNSWAISQAPSFLVGFGCGKVPTAFMYVMAREPIRPYPWASGSDLGSSTVYKGLAVHLFPMFSDIHLWS